MMNATQVTAWGTLLEWFWLHWCKSRWKLFRCLNVDKLIICRTTHFLTACFDYCIRGILHKRVVHLSNHISWTILDDQLVSIPKSAIPFCKYKNMQIRWFRSPPRCWFIDAKVDTYWITYFATSDCSGRLPCPSSSMSDIFYRSLCQCSWHSHITIDCGRMDNIKCYASGPVLRFVVSLITFLSSLTIALPLKPSLFCSIYMRCDGTKMKL